jgi:hypothetical protein
MKSFYNESTAFIYNMIFLHMSLFNQGILSNFYFNRVQSIIEY